MSDELDRSDSCNDIKKETSNESSSEDLVDPRVQVELERLNAATDLINKLEIELDEARSHFRMLLSESSIKINQLAKKLGSCVEKAKPYYEARMKAKQLQFQTQKAAFRYERASSAHSAAKEMVFLAEEGLKSDGSNFDPAWQEMLNHATLRVNEAESERVLSQHDHQKISAAYNEADKIVQHLHQDLKKAIVKSSLSTRRSLLQLNNLAYQHQLQLLPYFEMKAQFNQLLDEQRKGVHHLEENVLKIKMNYAEALHNLEEISDEIHQRRKENHLSENCDLTSESSSYSLESTQKISCSQSPSISSDKHCLKNASSEDLFMSLPDNLKPEPSLIALSCATANTSSIKISSDDDFNETVEFEGVSRKGIKENGQGAIANKEETVFGANNYVNISKCIDKLEIENEVCATNLRKNELVNNGEISDYKFFPADISILRLQREEFSDSESLASTDTIDTLDDNQIECLMLEKMLHLDEQETN